MKSAIAAALLTANVALAAPGTAARWAKHAQRSAAKSSKPMKAAPGQIEAVEAGNISHVEYSSNWAGAVLIGSGYKTVTGTFTVPTPSSAGSAAAWVGIDGDTCDTSILQTGVDFTKSGNSISYDAWYEWYPAYSYDFSGIDISAGDSITVTVVATSTSAGTATVENTSTGQTVTHTFSSETDKLCEENAEWIVEDYEEGSSLVEFADFGTVTFTDCSVNGDIGVTGATIIDIEQNNKVLTSCSTSGSSTVTCSYV
ncbi:peptidase A4 family-domain-containing protein [Xylariaceae sp. FL0804]|nr:peptidase A4 family-domain-containing protein [Xylariaceae sp. FL0804]